MSRFDPRRWFRKTKPEQSQPEKPPQPSPHAAPPPLPPEIADFLDPYGYQASIIDGDESILDLTKTMDNVRELMERLELDPEHGLLPANAITAKDADVIARHTMWELVLVHTAWSARNILAARWPEDLFAHPIPSESQLSTLIEAPGMDIEESHAERAKSILNRALASSEQINELPELDGLSEADRMNTWVPLLAWYWVKCQVLHHPPQ